MDNNDIKNRTLALVDECIKYRLMCFLGDDFLAFLANAQNNPSEEIILQLKACAIEHIQCLTARAENYRPQPPAQNPPAENSQQLEKISVVNLFVN